MLFSGRVRHGVTWSAAAGSLPHPATHRKSNNGHARPRTSWWERAWAVICPSPSLAISTNWTSAERDRPNSGRAQQHDSGKSGRQHDHHHQSCPRRHRLTDHARAARRINSAVISTTTYSPTDNSPRLIGPHLSDLAGQLSILSPLHDGSSISATRPHVRQRGQRHAIPSTGVGGSVR